MKGSETQEAYGIISERVYGLIRRGIDQYERPYPVFEDYLSRTKKQENWVLRDQGRIAGIVSLIENGMGHEWRITMEFIRKDDIPILENESQDSYQLLWNENSKSERVTITKVHVHPGKTNGRHKHESSEQIWIALKGRGILLLDDEKIKIFSQGDVVRFAEGDTHGITNDTNEEFIYISVTSPPINFRYAYTSTTRLV